MLAEPHDPGVECTIRTEDGFDRECSRDVGDLGQPGRSPCRQRSDGGHTLRVVDEGETFLGLEHHRLEATAMKGPDGREPFARQPYLTFAYDGEGEMCERSEVTRRAERALFGHDGGKVSLEHLDEPQHDLASDPEWPSARSWARRASMARTSSADSSLSTATACDRRSPCWRAVE
jgi:hypothetical protein